MDGREEGEEGSLPARKRVRRRRVFTAARTSSVRLGSLSPLRCFNPSPASSQVYSTSLSMLATMAVSAYMFGTQLTLPLALGILTGAQSTA